MTMHPGAVRAICLAMAKGLRPKPPVPFDQWLPENIVLVDGPKKGELWSPDDAPYLLPIAACLSYEHPCTEVTVRKAQQTGVSILALSWMLYLAENAPDNMLYAVPGIDMLQDINSGKLQPLIDAWSKHSGREVIAPDVSRSGRGSTIYEKRFSGGSIYLGNANVVTDLSGKTIRFGVKDEVSKWQRLPNGADPENLFFGRFTAFRRQQTYKILGLSTPELDSGDPLGEKEGHCRIDRDFRRSDQRYWHIRCPECQTEQVQIDANLIIDRKHLHNSRMACTACGHHISESERVQAVRSGRYIPTFTEPDRHPGFHVDAFMSLMMSYGAIAEDKIKYEAKGEAGLKDYANLVCALPYHMKGNAPDHQRLMERREPYPAGVIPAEGLIFVGGADVQSYGIYVEGVAFGEDRQSWNIFADFLPGATDHPQEGAFRLLAELIDREFPNVFGVLRQMSAIGVDCGYRTNTVLEFCRRTPRAIAVKGMPGRGRPAIELPQKKSVTRSGKRQRVAGAVVVPVGTWALKAELYGNLHKLGLRAGEACDPAGYCHFHMDLGEEYFKQLTAEYFYTSMKNGKYVEEWRPRREDNHFLDCRVYAMAMAEREHISKLTASQWALLRQQYGQIPDVDLFSSPAQKVLAEDAPQLPLPGSPVARAEPDVKTYRNRFANR
jgi:phage terminase large subunit GpA-like protein